MAKIEEQTFRSYADKMGLKHDDVTPVPSVPFEAAVVLDPGVDSPDTPKINAARSSFVMEKGRKLVDDPSVERERLVNYAFLYGWLAAGGSLE